MLISIGNKIISSNSSTYIIAEAGVNHNGNIELAKKLIDVAVIAGANAVKFQTFKTENVVSKFAPKVKYQMKNTGNEESQYEMIKKLELSHQHFKELFHYCQKRGIQFLSSPFDQESADMLDKLGIDAFKIGSGEIINLPFLSYLTKKKKPVILSTGMADLGEIEEALTVMKDLDIILLHATSNYPTPFEDVNLLGMKTIENAFKKIVGYSDHTVGMEVSLAAVALGAKVIEKHFTLDKNMTGPDHQASLTPDELISFVRAIRNLEKSLGNGIKRTMPSEQETRMIARKSIVANQKIKAGTAITKEMLTLKRPGNGIAPKYLDQIVGLKINKDVEPDQVLQWKHFINREVSQ